MAELINLEVADKELKRCSEVIEKFKRLAEHSYSSGTVWSKEQNEQVDLCILRSITWRGPCT